MLTTVEAVKEQLCIPTDDTSQDNMLERMIKAASDAIEVECRREFEKREHEDKFDLTGEEERIILTGYPIEELTEITLDDEAKEEYDLNKQQGILRPKKSWRGKLKVKYTAGYIFPGENGRTLPYDLEDAAILWAVQKYNVGGAVGISGERVDQLNIDYASHGGQALGVNLLQAPTPVLSVIRRYKDWRR